MYKVTIEIPKSNSDMRIVPFDVLISILEEYRQSKAKIIIEDIGDDPPIDILFES